MTLGPQGAVKPKLLLPANLAERSLAENGPGDRFTSGRFGVLTVDEFLHDGRSTGNGELFFQVGQGKLQLNGEASDYIFAPYNLGCSYAAGIHLRGTDNSCSCGGGALIGVVQDIFPNALNLSDAS